MQRIQPLESFSSFSPSSSPCIQSSKVIHFLVSFHWIFGLTILGSIVYGTILRRNFQNGNECEMSWSHYDFLPIQLSYFSSSTYPLSSSFSTSTKHTVPRVYKFMDHRDPRRLRQRPRHGFGQAAQDGYRATIDSDICPTGDNNTSQHFILYIPGYGGSYQQARSLGVHGLQLARHVIPQYEQERIRQGLMDGNLHSSALNVSDFIFDVYTMDFDHHFAKIPLHAFPLYKQARDISNVIYTFTKQCPLVRDVTLVGHSLGSIVARKAITSMIHEQQQQQQQQQQDNTQNPILVNLITLASPHQYMPFLLESSLFQFYHQLQKEEEIIMNKSSSRAKHPNSYIPNIQISLSGGLKDELIPPEASFWNIGMMIPSTSTTRIRTTTTSYSTTIPIIKPMNLLTSQIMTWFPLGDNNNDNYGDNHNNNNNNNESKKNHVCSNGIHMSYGMDHKAIVWCWNTLDFIRQLIHVMITTTPLSFSSSSCFTTSSSTSTTITTSISYDRNNSDVNDRTSINHDYNENSNTSTTCMTPQHLETSFQSIKKFILSRLSSYQTNPTCICNHNNESNYHHPLDDMDVLYNPSNLVSIQRRSLHSIYGSLSSILLQSTMLYNLQLFIVFYLFHGSFFLLLLFIHDNNDYVQHRFDTDRPTRIHRLIILLSLYYFLGPLFMALTVSYFFSLSTLSSYIYIPPSTIYFILPSYAAMTLYWILYLFSWMLGQRIYKDLFDDTHCITKILHTTQLPCKSCSLRKILILKPLYNSIGIIFILCIINHILSNIQGSISIHIIYNMKSLQSFTFIIWNIWILLSIIKIGYFPGLEWAHDSSKFPKLVLSIERIGIIVLLFPLYFYLSLGKMYLAFSLLTEEGQRDAEFYLLAANHSNSLEKPVGSFILTWFYYCNYDHLLQKYWIQDYLQFSVYVSMLVGLLLWLHVLKIENTWKRTRLQKVVVGD